MSERNGIQEYLENKTDAYLAAIPTAVRKAVIECVKDLADEAFPDYVVRGARDVEDELNVQAFDEAIDQFTKHLKETLLLDPTPWIERPDSIVRTNKAGSFPTSVFKPRLFYSQNPEDYA